MSNFIVPNTFVPGTKAKAQEVNENFTSIQNELNSKAEKVGNSSQVFSVADAAENSHAVNKSQLDNAINTTSESLSNLISRIGTAFVIERAYTNSSGNPAYMTYSGGVLSFRVNDNTYGPIVALPANNLPRFSVNSVNSLDLSAYSNGTYNVFLKSNGTAYVYKNTIYTQKAAPASPSVNSIFVNPYVSPIIAKIYQNASWQNFDDVYLGTVTVSGNVITAVKHVEFNDNGFNVNKSNITIIKQSYKSGNSGYRIYTDGYCEQWGYVTGGASVTVSLLKTFENAKYCIVLGSAWTTITYNTVDTGNKTASSFVRLGGANSHGCYWRACGFLAAGQY